MRQIRNAPVIIRSWVAVQGLHYRVHLLEQCLHHRLRQLGDLGDHLTTEVSVAAKVQDEEGQNRPFETFAYLMMVKSTFGRIIDAS